MAADNKEYATVLSTDMSKAFDSLHPAPMIQKLKAYGFSETSLNLLRSFPERRRNRVKLQEAHGACIREICEKTSCKVGVLLRLRNLTPWSAKLQLYKSNILPHLTYCGVVWHFCKSSDKKKMERIQERALRAVLKSKSETYTELLTRAALPSLYQQRLQNIAILMYKVKNGLLPTYITEIFNTTPKQYNLRNADFNIPRFRTHRALWKALFTIFWAPSLEQTRQK